jgi:hypothetical protein
MIRSHSYYFSRMEKHIYSDIIAVLRNVDPTLAPTAAVGTKLGEVKEFTNLVQLGQRQGAAIYNVDGGTSDSKAEAKQAFDEIARAVIERAI